MIEILEIILWWLCAILMIAAVCVGAFFLFRWQAKQAAQKDLAEERSKFDEAKASLDKRELGFQKDTARVMDNYFKKRDELKLQQEKAAEELSTVQKIKEEAQLKIAQIMRENTQLRNNLIAARQRAKRLAKKAQSGV